ncbi:MAG TPA: hypothetical protein VFN83_01825 [Gemmatimonadales bacterium]|jgi:hypothetical protein|nr:hypothetical protein [Gemmatimonadales bacterium]
MWIIALVLLLALLIPILGILLDSPIGRALARRLEGPEQGPPELAELARKVELLEAEVDDLTRSVDALKEDNAFLQRLIEDAPMRPPLPPGGGT